MSMVRQKNVDILFKYLLWQLPDFQKVQFKYTLTTIWGSYSWHKLKSLFSNLESSFTSAKNIRSSTSLKQGKTIPAYLEQACRTLQSTWRARIELATCTIWTCVALTFPTASCAAPNAHPCSLACPTQVKFGICCPKQGHGDSGYMLWCWGTQTQQGQGWSFPPLGFFSVSTPNSRIQVGVSK